MTTTMHDPENLSQSMSNVNVSKRLAVPANPPPRSLNSPQCEAASDSGYASNDIAASTRAAKSVRAESVDAENPRAAGSGVQVQDGQGQPTSSHPNTDTPVEGAQTTPRPPEPLTPFYLAKRKNAFRFDVDPPTRVRRRWSIIYPLLSAGLEKKLGNYGTPLNCALRLLMLGEASSSPADARPVIVAFCPKSRSSGVKRFFKKRKVKKLYRPRSSDPDQPDFDFDLGKPPEETARKDGIQVVLPEKDVGQRPLDPCATLCGTPIQLRHPGSGLASSATLGGLIKVVDNTNQVGCFGLTTDHVVPPASSKAVMSRKFGKHQVIGNVVDSCSNRHDSVVGKYYDWGLIQLLLEHLAPNYLSLQGYNATHDASGYSAVRLPELQSVDTTFLKAVGSISVVVMTGSGGPKKGFLSTLPCAVMLGPGTKFITAYAVSFPQKGAIRDGDSGAWVVNESTLEVIGHIVALDPLGDAYVIPLKDVFADIKARLGAKSVELASASWIRSVGVVSDLLHMAGTPQLDAIRGNGLERASSPPPHIWSMVESRSEGSDSGYGSSASISTTHSAAPPERETKPVIGLRPLAIDDAIPEDFVFSTGKWITGER